MKKKILITLILVIAIILIIFTYLYGFINVPPGYSYNPFFVKYPVRDETKYTRHFPPYTENNLAYGREIDAETAVKIACSMFELVYGGEKEWIRVMHGEDANPEYRMSVKVAYCERENAYWVYIGGNSTSPIHGLDYLICKESGNVLGVYSDVVYREEFEQQMSEIKPPETYESTILKLE